MNDCKLCNNIKNLSYLYAHEDEELIFKYDINGFPTYKYYKDRKYTSILKCPKCSRVL